MILHPAYQPLTTRASELFDIIVDFPKSSPALEDLRVGVARGVGGGVGGTVAISRNDDVTREPRFPHRKQCRRREDEPSWPKH